LQTNTGFDFIGGGDDVIVSFAPNSDYTGSVTVEFTDDTLESLDITITMSGPSAAAFIGRNGNGATYSNTFTRTIPIVDEAADFTVFPFIFGSVGVNTTSFDLIAFSATSGAWGGTVGPTLGSSAPGEDNNGIDITNITVEFTDISEMGTPIKGDVNMSGEVTFADIPPFILALQNGTFLPEADTNCDMQVSFADIPPFITLLQGN